MTDKSEESLTLDEMIAEVQEQLKILETSLPTQIDPIGISRTKLPFKVLNYREAAIWRRRTGKGSSPDLRSRTVRRRYCLDAGCGRNQCSPLVSR
jgi:hypothetical protein